MKPFRSWNSWINMLSRNPWGVSLKTFWWLIFDIILICYSNTWAPLSAHNSIQPNTKDVHEWNEHAASGMECVVINKKKLIHFMWKIFYGCCVVAGVCIYWCCIYADSNIPWIKHAWRCVETNKTEQKTKAGTGNKKLMLINDKMNTSTFASFFTSIALIVIASFHPRARTYVSKD